MNLTPFFISDLTGVPFLAKGVAVLQISVGLISARLTGDMV